MRRSVRLLATLAAIAALPALAQAQWSDNFDSYANGTPLHGVGGWAGWDNNPGATGYVTNAQSHSAPHSVEIRPTTDLVQQFNGVGANTWMISGWSYCPTGGTGEQYWILLNTYVAGDPTSNNWSLDLLFDQTGGVVRDFDNPATPTIPLIRNQWVQVRVVIDFTANTQQVFYGATLFTTKSWTEGASGGGKLNLDALDLYSNAGSTIYWDDLVLAREGATPVESTTWGGVKGAFRR
jgi:hypothetical protein